MYTYKISQRLSEILNIEFIESVCTSDQELNKIPEDALTDPHKAYSNLGTIAAAEVNRGRKRPEHSALMKAKGIKPPIGSHKGHKHSEESRKLIGEKSGAGRLGKKRGSYAILNRKIETCNCGRTISGAYNIKKHYERCKQT
jgi:hypothetical protein